MSSRFPNCRNNNWCSAKFAVFGLLPAEVQLHGQFGSVKLLARFPYT